MRRLVLPLVLAAVPVAAVAATIKPAGVTASSSEANTADANYDAANVADGKQSTVWVEGEEGSGLGSWVQLDLGAPRTVSALKVWSGNWYTWDFWNRHNRPKEVEAEFSDGTKQSFTLKDAFAPEVLRLSKPVTTSSVKLKIKSVYNGTTFNDTCLSEVQVLDDVAPEHVAVSAYKASSTYPADSDGNYEPTNLEDGILDSMWCEGNKAGDGAGEWLDFQFGSAQSVSRLKVRNGNAVSMSFNMKGNRAKAVTLKFSDGSTESIELKPVGTEQIISFPARKTSSVRVTFGEVVKGKEFNDLCLSEAYFLP